MEHADVFAELLTTLIFLHSSSEAAEAAAPVGLAACAPGCWRFGGGGMCLRRWSAPALDGQPQAPAPAANTAARFGHGAAVSGSSLSS